MLSTYFSTSEENARFFGSVPPQDLAAGEKNPGQMVGAEKGHQGVQRGQSQLRVGFGQPLNGAGVEPPLALQ